VTDAGVDGSRSICVDVAHFAAVPARAPNVGLARRTGEPLGWAARGTACFRVCASAPGFCATSKRARPCHPRWSFALESSFGLHAHDAISSLD